MARQIAALTGPGTISLKINNRSSIPADEIPAIRKALEQQLRSAGVVVQAKSVSSDVRLTLSENLRGWLWVAEVQEGSETKVAMIQVAGASGNASSASNPQMSLRSTLLFSQAEPMLDAALLAGQRMVVLEPARVKTYAFAGATWQLAQSFDIPHDGTLPRDLRGHIAVAVDHLFDAYLPGVICTASNTGDAAALAVACGASDDPWPVASQKAFFNPTRNYFTGVLVPGFGAKLPPFYSATQLARAVSPATLFADVSGQVHLFENNTHRLVVGARDWGSDIAGVRSDCGSGTQILATSAGSPRSDALRAYEVSGREAMPASAPLSFEGTIISLWASADGTSATAIVRNPQETRYEAYSVSVVCSR